MSFSIITTCKSRLSHLKQVIGSWKAINPTEIIVVDVSCPDKTALWLKEHHPDVTCVSAPAEVFNLSHARNIGAQQAKCNILFFVDADVVLDPNMGDWISENYIPGTFYVRHKDTVLDGVHEAGSALCGKQAFMASHGYDDAIGGYGCEDLDFYLRLQRLGVKQEAIPKIFFKSLEHSDQVRTENYAIKDKKLSATIVRTYVALKHAALKLNDHLPELPLADRKMLYNKVVEQLNDDFGSLAGRVITIDITNRKWLPEPYVIKMKTQISVEIDIKAEK